MIVTEITSKSNDKIKQAAKLVSSAAQRRKEKRFLLEGSRLCFDALSCGFAPAQVFVTENALHKYRDRAEPLSENAEEVYMISDSVAAALADTVNPQGVFCVFKMKPQGKTEIVPNGKYLALDGVQDPSNLGAAARTAEALGLSGLITAGGCDVFNPKAQRAAMGALLRLPVTDCADLPALITNCRKNGMLTFAAVPYADAEKITEISLSRGTVAVVGNEGNGVSGEVQNACEKLVTVPMLGRAESLNASAAAAIVMWEMMR